MMKLYTSPACVPCKKLKGILDDMEVQYEEIDVFTDQEAVKYLMGLGVSGVPVLMSEDGKMFRGNPSSEGEVRMWVRRYG